MNSDDENQGKWTRITLRLPPQLHKMLTESAGTLSLNAAIVQRLNDSFAGANRRNNYEDMRKAILEDLKQEMRDMLADIQKEQREEDNRS